MQKCFLKFVFFLLGNGDDCFGGTRRGGWPEAEKHGKFWKYLTIWKLWAADGKEEAEKECATQNNNCTKTYMELINFFCAFS